MLLGVPIPDSQYTVLTAIFFQTSYSLLSATRPIFSHRLCIVNTFQYSSKAQHIYLQITQHSLPSRIHVCFHFISHSQALLRQWSKLKRTPCKRYVQTVEYKRNVCESQTICIYERAASWIDDSHFNGKIGGKPNEKPLSEILLFIHTHIHTTYTLSERDWLSSWHNFV